MRPVGYRHVVGQHQRLVPGQELNVTVGQRKIPVDRAGTGAAGIMQDQAERVGEIGGDRRWNGGSIGRQRRRHQFRRYRVGVREIHICEGERAVRSTSRE